MNSILNEDEIKTSFSTLFAILLIGGALDKNTVSANNSTITKSDIQRVIQKYTHVWETEHPNNPLWVLGAGPSDLINIPGVRFLRNGQEVAGMHQAIHCELIVINNKMTFESQLSTFLHEYGHLKYEEIVAINERDEINSEAAAIKFSLEALCEEGYSEIAVQEALKIKEMTTVEPYKSAVTQLSVDSVWNKFAC